MNDNNYIDLYSIYNGILNKNDKRIRREKEEAEKQKRETDRHYAYLESEDNSQFLINYYLYRDFILNQLPNIIQKFLERIYYRKLNSTNNILKKENFVIPFSLSKLQEDFNVNSETIGGLHPSIFYQFSKNEEIMLSQDIYATFKTYLTNFILDYQIGKVEKNNVGDEKIAIYAPIEKVIYAYYLECERIARLDEDLKIFDEEENVNFNREVCEKLKKKIKVIN